MKIKTEVIEGTKTGKFTFAFHLLLLEIKYEVFDKLYLSGIFSTNFQLNILAYMELCLYLDTNGAENNKFANLSSIIHSQEKVSLRD